MKFRLCRMLLSLSLALLLYSLCKTEIAAAENADQIISVRDTKGNIVFTFCGNLQSGDEYISKDNILYRITSVQDSDAVAKQIGPERMPDVSWLDAGESQPVFASLTIPVTAKSASGNRGLIAMYVTHSDESYVPSDGTQSINGQGGIYDVARGFRDALQSKGIDVILDESTHLPHDAGAYRRSRQTAERLLQKRPDAIIDIHRDGIPDKSEYTCTIQGKEASQVRLLVGKANQNSAVNREFAKQLKAIGDKRYPGLIKDIFIGKGTYNQDLSPNAILLEFGTHTISKDRVLNSTGMMADVVSTSLYGQHTGSAVSQQNKSTAARNNKAAGSGVIWLLVLIIAGVALFAFAQTGSISASKTKIARGFSEITGGLISKKSQNKKK